MTASPQFPDTFPTVFPHHTPFTMECWRNKWWELHGLQVEVLGGRPLDRTPKTWKRIGHVGGPSDTYAPMILYMARDGGFRWSQFRDGSFYDFHGTIKVLWNEKSFGHELTHQEYQQLLLANTRRSPRPIPNRALKSDLELIIKP